MGLNWGFLKEKGDCVGQLAVSYPLRLSLWAVMLPRGTNFTPNPFTQTLPNYGMFADKRLIETTSDAPLRRVGPADSPPVGTRTRETKENTVNIDEGKGELISLVK